MTAGNEGEPLFSIQEVYYEDNGMPTGHGEPSLMSESIEGLNWVLDLMKKAIDQPVLTPEDFRGDVK